ncbi:MAG: TauD/TfdA family dioxygenase [Alphaproteobacteria bacterium]|nr:TauD/TfdA family dioxygenase [Alphaproteobacteria bacterium]
MDYERIDVKPMAGGCGAEIEGVDLSAPMDDATFAEINRAFLDHQVIFFRDQHLTPDQHKDFGRRFGALNIHPQYEPLDGHPEILPVLKEPADADNIGGAWHADVTFMKKPVMGSILYALEVPSVGGDTMFANQYMAYETLSPGMQAMLERMTAIHSDGILSDAESIKTRNKTRSTKLREDAALAGEVETEHPVVCTHPETKRKLLYVNRPFTQRFKDMTEEESRPLLDYLFEHSARPEFTCRFRWAKNSIAMWDNRCVQHYALNDYPGERRSMHRVTIEGDQPF